MRTEFSMRYFIAGSAKNPLTGTDFDGAFKWHLPALLCPECRHYRSSRLGIPNLDIEGRLDASPYERPGSVNPETYVKLFAPIEAINSTGFPLLPGIGFGPFMGRIAKPESKDFLWIWNDYLLIKETAFLSLSAMGLSFTTGPAQITSSRPPILRSDYVRIAQIRAVRCMAAETLKHAETRECRGCGLKVQTRPKRLFLEQSLIPADLDLFSPEECLGTVVSERFHDVAQRLRLTNIRFEPVELL
jgi:hypothetical protein